MERRFHPAPHAVAELTHEVLIKAAGAAIFLLTKLITTASPIAPLLYPGGNYAQERDDYVGSYRAATD